MVNKLLEVRDLSFSYEDNRYALEHISVDIHERERIAVLGANGAGKSTFFLNLNGVREPESGDIYLRGSRIDKKSRSLLRKSVGIVFQDADSQLIASTVKAEIAFGPLNMKLDRQEVEKRTLRAAEQMNLLPYLERPPHYLSGGEKKRVSIADILAMDCDVIIFDEPTASLDPLNARLLEEILQQLHREGKTVMLSTHDVDFASRFADRVLIFHEGKLIADDTPQRIFADRELLKRASLAQPVMMQVCELLEHNGLLQVQGRYPDTLKELEQLLQKEEKND